MKNHASPYWVNLISITTAAVCIGVPWNLAMADDAVPSPAPATITAPPAPPATPPPAPAATPAPALPYGVSEVVKMYQGGINKDVLVSYVENTVLPFHLTADAIIYLQHLGMPQEVTAAMIRRDGELQKQAMAAYQQQPSAPYPQQQPLAPGNAPQPMAMPNTPPPTVNPYPDVAPPPLGYPDYSGYPYSPYYYGPDVVVAGGWGWGWGPHGWGWGPGFGRGGFGRGGFAGHGGFGGHR